MHVSISKQEIIEALEWSIPYRDEDMKSFSLFGQKLGTLIINKFSEIRLIGEIECSEGKETYEVLKDSIRKVLAHFGENASRQIVKISHCEWRAILSLYFVWGGIFSYGEESGHDFWPQVTKGLGFESDSNISNGLGQLFITCLQENRLEEFSSFKSGKKYTSRILLHGLIPNKYFDRFIRDFIVPVLNEHFGVYSTGRDLIKQWKQNVSNLPKPIQRFIEHGEPVNILITERLLDMAKRWDINGAIAWRQWGLPQYMVDAFNRIVSENPIISNCLVSDKNPQESAYLYFNLEQSDTPQIHIPSYKIVHRTKLKLSWNYFNGKSHEDLSHLLRAVPIKGEYHSIREDIAISPAYDGWRLEMIDSSNQVIFRQTIQSPMPVNNEDNRVPLFFFNRATGKSLNIESLQIPDELIIVFQQDSILECKDGNFLTDPEQLTGEWRDWKYVLCNTLSITGFEYVGVEGEFADITFSREMRSRSPELVLDKTAPWWIRCAEGFPVYLEESNIALTCSEKSFLLWRRAFITINRLDSPEFIGSGDLKFEKNDANEYMAFIPITTALKAGVYEIRLRGSLGLEDVNLHFVYLPISNLKKISGPETGIVSAFHFSAYEDVDINAQLNTKIEPNEMNYEVSIITESGDAYCSLKFFSESTFPISILLARSDLRWSRRSEAGLFHWDIWKCLPEEIPIQRIDEITDAKVAVQFDSIYNGPGQAKKLKLLLKTVRKGQKDSTDLMSYDAPTLSRKAQDTWIVDLKKFSSNLKSFSNVEEALVAVKTFDDRNELVLFIVQRKPDYKNISVIINKNSNNEKLKISWTPQPNDPVTKRIVNIFHVAEKNVGKRHRIEDGAQPPIDISIEYPETPGLWGITIDTEQPRFSNTSRQCDLEPVFKWFRAPISWADWLEYPEITPEDALEKIETINIDNFNLEKELPWLNFLNAFNYDAGHNSLRLMRSVLGDKLIEGLLPYSDNTVWQVKSSLGSIRSEIKVQNSSASAPQLDKLIIERPPCGWNRIPNEIDLDLLLIKEHPNLGGRGNKWRLSKSNKAADPCMYSGDGSVMSTTKCRI